MIRPITATATALTMLVSPAPTGPVHPLAPASNGEAIVRVRVRLVELGYLSHALPLSPVYDGTLGAALANYQDAMGLPQTSLMDAATLTMLFETGDR